MLIPVRDREALKKHGIPLAPTTLRRWHHEGRYAQIFVKIGGILCINMREWEKFIAEKSKEEYQKAERYQRLKG